jgi:hypothetical protein
MEDEIGVAEQLLVVVDRRDVDLPDGELLAEREEAEGEEGEGDEGGRKRRGQTVKPGPRCLS